MGIVQENRSITANTSMVLDATNYLGSDANISFDSDYSNNMAARTTIPEGVIMETDWFPADSFTGNHQFSMAFKTDYNGTALVLEVYRRTPGSSIETKTQSIGYITDGVGFKITDQIGFFNAKYEYKFRIIASRYFTGTYVDVDYLQILRINKNQHLTWLEGYAYSPELVGLQNFIQVGSFEVTNNGDSSSTGSVTFPTAFETAPYVIPTILEGTTATPYMVVNTYNVVASGFTALVRTDDATGWSGSVYVEYIAIGQIRPLVF